MLLTDPRVGAVSFIGSIPIVQYIYATASAHGKHVRGLGGAKNHMVMLDADLDQVVSALMGAAQHARAGWGTLLYPDEDGDGALDPESAQSCRVLHANHEVMSPRLTTMI